MALFSGGINLFIHLGYASVYCTIASGECLLLKKRSTVQKIVIEIGRRYSTIQTSYSSGGEIANVNFF